MPDLTALNARFGSPGRIVFEEGPAGLTLVSISNDQAKTRVALQGAHLLSWQPTGQQPVIWLSSAARFGTGKAIRGGVPVCWPWFGPHASESVFPAHGFARTTPWQVLDVDQSESGATRLKLRLIQGEASRSLWPYNTPLEIHVTVGTELSMELVTRNIGASPVVLSQALHTYFAVADVRRIRLTGLEGCRYIDQLDGDRRKEQRGSVSFAAETDRIYLDSTADCLIEDPGLRRRIRITKSGSRSTVVWNPWIEKSSRMGDLGEDGYLTMICVETANAADDAVTIAPGAEHRLGVCYTVETLG